MKGFQFVRGFAVLAACVGLHVAAPAAAAVPALTQIEGILTSSSGGPAADGNYNITFSIYKEEVAGNALYAEGPVLISIKNGTFAYPLGSKSKLDAAVLGQLGGGWLGVKIEGDAELPRKPMYSSAYAVRAAVAEGLDCSGCIGDKHIDATLLAKYAKLDQLSAVATSGNFKDLTGSPPAPDLSGYPKKTDLKPVAFSGEYKDLTGGPDLSAYKKFADMPGVAQTGSYKDLNDQPKLPKIGEACGTGLVMQGIKADGTYDCISNMDLAALPPDGIDEISNKLIFNQFVDSFDGKPNVPIKDNWPTGIEDIIDFPDIGVSQKLSVSIDVGNSDVSTVAITLTDPKGGKFELWKGDGKGGQGAKVVKVFPDPDKTVSGDLTTWFGQNPKGKWRLQAFDTGFKDNGMDGQINKWTISIQTLSNKKIAIAGDLIVSGSFTSSGANGVKLGNEKTVCDVANVGFYRHDATWGLQRCQMSEHQNGSKRYVWAVSLQRPVMWSGGCKSSSTSTSWTRYCLDGTDFNTAADYLNVNADGVVTVKIAGFYRVHLWGDGHTGSYRRCVLKKNGSDFAYTHQYDGHGGWHHCIIQNVWNFKEGDTMEGYFQMDQGGTLWHSWNAAGQHSRFQMEYIGPL